MSWPSSSRSWAGARIAVLSPTPTHPQDYGNRKRIFRVCSRYAEEGAQVTFIHYPAELEWRGRIPRRADQSMRQTWNQYFTVAPTRLLHTDPIGHYHTIDEWWDPAIGQFLTWLFSVQSFDAFIVNYSWLSKALEFAPRSTFKILDTHDKFSGRRQVLESLGLHGEFFYTTDAEERIALDRSDLVWAIKREEAAELAVMTRSPVLALPHLDPFTPIQRPAPDAEGYFRVGVMGARNNVNRMNITAFLQAAEPIFRDAFASVKIVVGGTVCGMLENRRWPFVELRGRVDKVEDFYASVDCVAVPMRVSTGLKIKTGEALAFGLPVVALAHAFEGYEPSDPLHRLNDFTDMARALVDLSFAPRARLDTLAGCSRRAHELTAALLADAYRRSDLMVREKRQQILVAVDSRAFIPGSIFNLALNSALEDLGSLAAVTVLVAKGSARDVAANADSADRFRRVVVAQDLADVELLRDELSQMGVSVFELDEYLRRARPAVLIADALHGAVLAGLPDTVAISRTEMLALSQGSGDFAIPGKGYCRAYVTAPRLSARLAVAMAAAGAEFAASPCIWRSDEAKFAPARDSSGARKVAVMGDPSAPAVRLAAGMACIWGLEPFLVTGFGRGESAGLDSMEVGEFVNALVEGRALPPAFAIDLSAGEPGLSLARELLDRLHIPVVATSQCAPARSLRAGGGLLAARSENELWAAVRALAVEPAQAHAAALRLSWRELEGDRGWGWIARYCANVFEINDAQFA